MSNTLDTVKIDRKSTNSIIGNIHSFESMGNVDGPGIRSVVFMQGCNLRCSFCHNPDTWSTEANYIIKSSDLMQKILKFKPYFDSSGGGVTFSGGDPLLQPEFLLDMLMRCKSYGIHTAIDTSGVGHSGKAEFRPSYAEILEYTDLVLLDVKHVNREIYKNITNVEMDYFDGFLESLKKSRTKVWIRSVIIPGVNDTDEYISDLWNYSKRIPHVTRFELLPYHLLGVNKYEQLGMKYRLDGTPPMDKEKTKKWENILNTAIIAE